MPDRLEISFPYLDFDVAGGDEDGDQDHYDDEDDYTDHPPLTLPNGKAVKPEGVFEMVDYMLAVTLNDIGRSWLETLRIMEGAGFVEVKADEGVMVSVAPWHSRDV